MSRRRWQGTTLPELLVVISIMSILLFLAAKMVKFGYDFYRYTDESITLQREALLGLTMITQDITASHQRRVMVDKVDATTPEPNPHREDKVVIPLPKNMSGATQIDSDTGAALWMTVAGYEIDTSRQSRPLMRYLGDTINDVGDDFIDEDGIYKADVETVAEDEMPTVDEIKAYPLTGLSAKAVCRHVLEFKVTEAVDTIDIELTIMLKGVVANGNSLDNSLTLKTTVFPRN